MLNKSQVANSGLMKQMYERKLQEVEKQLATAVQTQVVQTSHALELLQKSYEDIIAINNNFQAIDAKCFECKSLLTHFPIIKKMSLARSNLNSSKAIHRLFHQIPARAKHLLQLLDTDADNQLLKVYRKVRKLVQLRDETLNKGLQYIDAENQQNMKNHFLLIDEVVIRLEKQIRQNIADGLFLAVEEPEIMVETLKICEFEDRNAEHKKMKRVLNYSCKDWRQWSKDDRQLFVKENKETEVMEEKKENKENIDMKEDVIIDFESREISNDSMKSKVCSEILDNITALVLNLDVIFSEGKQKSIKSFLDGIDGNTKDLEVVNEHLRLVYPPHYHIVHYYVSGYQNLLTPLIINRLEIDSVPTQERLFVVSWIAKFKASVLKLDQDMARMSVKQQRSKPTDIHSSSKSDTARMIEHLSEQENILLRSYIDTCNAKLQSWITNIVNTESREQNYFMVEEVPRTHCPQDLFTALNIQFNIAIQQLSGEPFVRVIKMVLQAMDIFHNQLSEHIHRNYLQFKDEYFCAMLNSCYDVSQKLKTRRDEILDAPEKYCLDVNQQTILDDMMDARICLFTTLSKECAQKLSEKVFIESLNEELLDNLFTDEWWMNDENENSLMENVIATIEDYLSDFQKWVDQRYFYWDCVKQLIIVLVDKYVRQLIKEKPKYVMVGIKIEGDCRIMNDYFMQSPDVSRLWTEKFLVLSAISGALACEDGFLDLYIKPLKDSPNCEQILEYIDKHRRGTKNKSSAKNGSGANVNFNKGLKQKMLRALKLDEQPN